MLAALSVRDVVLIDRLELEFGPGLSVLTGETGAGKSILLDALGLALGARADAGLVRRGAQQASVSATFDLDARHPAQALLEEHGLQGEDGLVLRRTLGADGRSRAFVNDQPVSVSLLRTLGDALVEIQGQSEQRGLLDPATHRDALDAFAGLGAALKDMHALWDDARTAKQAHEKAQAERAKAAAEEDHLCHTARELGALDPKDGEQATLEERRLVLKNKEKLAEALAGAHDALSGSRNVEDGLRIARRELTRIADKAGGTLDPALSSLDRASDAVADAVAAIEKVGHALEHDGTSLEKIEDRLYALRDMARKHRVAVADLPRLRTEVEEALGRIEGGEGGLKALAEDAARARKAYEDAARRVSQARAKYAKALDAQVMAELAPLKLDRSRFSTRIDVLPAADWGPHGGDTIFFEVATNPGSAPGPIGKIASGGELSRFMLALRVVLTRSGGASSIVFDEVDSGIGGAVAAAVGERLAKLGRAMQVLVVTHSPQVAARGDNHWRVAKAAGADVTFTKVTALDAEARREEIARMLSGSKITEEARAAADSLIGGGRRQRRP
jgi:DNA repair protein RecN (Recombination protein N)